jgi:hypothetical protein
MGPAGQGKPLPGGRGKKHLAPPQCSTPTCQQPGASRGSKRAHFPELDSQHGAPHVSVPHGGGDGYIPAALGGCSAHPCRRGGLDASPGPMCGSTATGWAAGRLHQQLREVRRHVCDPKGWTPSSSRGGSMTRGLSPRPARSTPPTSSTHPTTPTATPRTTLTLLELQPQAPHTLPTLHTPQVPLTLHSTHPHSSHWHTQHTHTLHPSLVPGRSPMDTSM